MSVCIVLLTVCITAVIIIANAKIVNKHVKTIGPYMLIDAAACYIYRYDTLAHVHQDARPTNPIRDDRMLPCLHSPLLITNLTSAASGIHCSLVFDILSISHQYFALPYRMHVLSPCPIFAKYIMSI